MADNDDVQLKLLNSNGKPNDSDNAKEKENGEVTANGKNGHKENDDNGNLPVEEFLEPGDFIDPTPSRAPDGGWGWMVVLGSFFCNFIVDGIMFSYGVMKEGFKTDFPDVEDYEIQIMGSLIPGLYLSLGMNLSLFHFFHKFDSYSPFCKWFT